MKFWVTLEELVYVYQIILGMLSGDGEMVSEAGQWTKSGTPVACLPFEAQECVQVNVL